jgi:HEAT repeat protein
VSVNKKLVAYHIGRLKDRSAGVRLKSIEELAQLGDPEALPALQEVFNHDSDLEVRKAAQEAGRAIFRKQANQ